MGNCLRHNERSSNMVWAGEDWASLKMTSQRHGDATERLRLLSDHFHHRRGDEGSSPPPPPSGREVKIRVSKRELEQLVGEQGLTVDQLLARVIISGHGHGRSDHGPHLERQRSWRPALQSIPEAN